MTVFLRLLFTTYVDVQMMNRKVINIWIGAGISILCIFLSVAFGQTKDLPTFYYAFGDKIELSPIPNKQYIVKSEAVSKSKFESLLIDVLGNISIDWATENICRVEFLELKDNDQIDQLLTDNSIVCINNAYLLSDNFEIGITNEVVIKFKDEVNSVERKELLENFGLNIAKSTKIYDILTIPKSKSTIKIANSLYETNFFEFAYPNIICKAESFGHYPNDPYFQYQFACHNTGQTVNGHTGSIDADIDAPEAWNITKGSANIIVAVFDEGVTSNHPDLPNTRQIRLNGSNFGSGNPDDPSPTGNSNHGNACAGVIGATMDNNIGIAGIAPNCKILPLRWDSNTLPDGMADGIVFATDNGANIISNSWGYNSYVLNFLPAIVAAIEYAISNNVVVVFAAGNNARHYLCNDDGFVQFPANSYIEGLITVGASDRYDMQSDYSPTSSKIDVVAPSHRAYPPESYSNLTCGGINGETLEMWTIDIPGNVGYNPWPSSGTHPPTTGEILPNTGNDYFSYTGRFGGTSHACPVVAGVAALMLSINPLLTPQDVYSTIVGTADKIGGYAYINGRCSNTGYGRVNAYNAVVSLSPPSPCTGTTNFVNQTVNSSATVTGCNINAQNVVVRFGSTLVLDATDATTINGSFEIQQGSSLEVR